MDNLRTTEAELRIDLERPLSDQDPLDRLNDLENKKRKHVDDIHDFFRANKRLKSSLESLKLLQRQLFKSLDDWEVSSLQYMKRFQGTNNMSSECNNVKLAIRNDKSEVVCAMKGKKASHPPKPVPNLKQLLHLLHMDLCGPMRVKSINGNRYVLVIVEDYSRYMWVYFIKSKDEAPEVIKTFLKKTQVLLQAPVIIKDREDIGKRGAKGDIGFFIGYSANSCAYRV
ncbi:retrovirus-related pol polyprotein from transposon TNT 1-94 [Tanacetum coccineum]|uniref:Retrovirus-related pol polyprotein from transposon TNT 1-94 n=1 Tax=Tanacetum coccineum TaxID=301880 RepID=A0ABQ5CIK5_9ASTR